MPAVSESSVTVFVCGPGIGEGVAVALPGRGWLLIDGCRVEGAPGADLPLLSVWRESRRGEDDPVEWAILTHPHRDHVLGFAEVIDATKPARIGLAGPPSPGRGLHAELSDWLTREAPATEELARNQLLAAAHAIRTCEVRTGRSVDALHDGLVILDGAVRATARAPRGAFAETLAGEGWPAFRDRANLLSTVVELTFGVTTLVLGGDLPHVVHGSVHAEGWSRVVADHTHLPGYTTLKVPHHGSNDALHDAFLARNGEPRTLWVTPYTPSRLPRLDDGVGLARLLALGDVLLTAPPRRPPEGATHPGAALTRAALRDWLSTPARAGFLADAEDITLPEHASPIDPVWRTELAGDRTFRSEPGATALRIVAEP